jgi:hypothetical protein
MELARVYRRAKYRENASYRVYEWSTEGLRAAQFVDLKSDLPIQKKVTHILLKKVGNTPQNQT